MVVWVPSVLIEPISPMEIFENYFPPYDYFILSSAHIGVEHTQSRIPSQKYRFLRILKGPVVYSKEGNRKNNEMNKVGPLFSS